MKITRCIPQINSLSLLIFNLLLFLPVFLFAQDIRELHNETPDDAYIPVDRESMEKGTPYKANGDGFFTVQANVDSSGNDMIGDAANEPSIAVDPTNPNRMVIGWRQFDTVSSNFRQAGNAYS